MILVTTTVEDLDRFVEIYSTAGAEKRKLHGAKGSNVFRDPNEEDRVWAIFDWDLNGWQSFASDPEVTAMMQRSRAQGSAPGRRARKTVRRLAHERRRRLDESRSPLAC